VLCALGKRAPRVFVQKGKADAVEPRLRRIFIPDEEKSISRIDNIIRHCMQARARNAELGNAIYYEMFETLFGKEGRQLELRSSFRYDIRIAQMPKSKANGQSYFRVNTRICYNKIIRNDVFMIGCAADNKQLAALFEDPLCEYRWLLGAANGLDLPRDFQVEKVRVDNRQVPIAKTKKTARGYEIWCGADFLKDKINREAKIEISITTKQAKDNKIFPVYLVYPTRGLEISFDYQKAKLKNVREESFFAGRHSVPRIISAKGKYVKVKVSDKEWTFPTSGVIFFWDV